MLFVPLPSRANHSEPHDESPQESATTTEPTSEPAPEDPEEPTPPEEQPEEEQSPEDTTDATASTTEEAVVTLHIRHFDQIIFEGQVSISATGTENITDNAGTVRQINAQSVLAMIARADLESEAFTITDLAYFASFDSYIINCITTPDMNEPICYEWQYVVNNTYQSVGVDDYILQENEDVYVFFGTPRRVTFQKTSFETGESFPILAEQYLYQENRYVPLPSSTIGIIQPNPDIPWEPIVIVTSTADEIGTAIFTLTNAGSYQAGLADDYYFPSVSFTVSAPQNQVPQNQNGGQPDSPINYINAQTAMEFLAEAQRDNGSILNDPIFTDWTAIAASAFGGGTPLKQNITHYLLTDPSPLSGINETADYERRAMALLALGVNPYNGTPTNYIQKILDAFDGVQFGNADLFNDDIFALFPLLHAGYTTSDAEITAPVAFILSKQETNGSWGSVDLTAAAIQALAPVSARPGVSDALTKAKTYLKNAQTNDGGFENTDSTSWTLQAIASLGEPETAWRKNGKAPNDFLASQQQADGGIGQADLPQTMRVWSTAYAIPAAMGKPWHAILQNVEKQETRNKKQETTPQTNNSGGGPAVISASPPLSPVITSIDVPLSLMPSQEGTLRKTLNNGKFINLSVPQGSITGNTVIHAAEETPASANIALPADMTLLTGTVFSITAQNQENQTPVTSFAKPLAVTFTIPDLPETTTTLRLAYFDEKETVWKIIPDAVFDRGAVRFTVDHLTRFGVFRVNEEQFDNSTIRQFDNSTNQENTNTNDTTLPPELSISLPTQPIRRVAGVKIAAEKPLITTDAATTTDTVTTRKITSTTTETPLQLPPTRFAGTSARRARGERRWVATSTVVLGALAVLLLFLGGRMAWQKKKGRV